MPSAVDFELTAMEPVLWSEPFDAPGWLYQVKWDGVRMFAVTGSGSTSLVNRHGHARTVQYPELGRLHERLPAGTVLDGEVVVLADGRPSFHHVMQRDSARRALTITANLKQWPISYLVFDVLYIRGKDVRRLPLSERQEQLLRIWPDDLQPLHLVENFHSGTALFAVVQQQKLEGIVAKRQESYYLPGKRSTDWRKIKLQREISCLVGGFTRRQGQCSALLLGLWNEEAMIYVGGAASGLTNADWQALDSFFVAANRETTPFVNPPAVRDRTAHWLEPTLAVRVRFLEWTPDMKLRAPVILGFQPGGALDCSFEGQGV